MTAKDWEAVPDKVQELYTKYAEDAIFLSHLHSEEPELWYVDDPDVGRICFSKEARDVFEKTSEEQSGTLQNIGAAFANMQKPIGGPNPLTTSLVGAALLGMLGHAGGAAAEQILPESMFEKGKLRRTGAFVGTLAGAGLGVPWAVNNIDEKGIKGLFSKEPFNQPSDGKQITYEQVKKAYLGEDYNPLYESVACSTGAAFTPSVDIDEWKKTIQNDPFMPAEAKAVAIGLPVAASMANQGSSFVSPYDIGRMAIGMGVGGAMGLGLGAVASAVTGLKPAGVSWLTRSGLIAGAVKSLVPGLF